MIKQLTFIPVKKALCSQTFVTLKLVVAYMYLIHLSIITFWTKIRKNRNRGTPRKSGFFQERGRKRVKEWGDVTFMKEWVKAMDNTKILAPADLKNLVSSPRYSYLKIPRSPNQISLVYFRAS